MSDRSFFTLFKRATKREMALLLFQKERQKEQSLIHSFKKSKRAKMSKKLAIFQIAHFSLKKKSDRSFSK